MLLNYLRADLKKTRHLPVCIACAAVPVACAAVFLLYYAYAPWESAMKIEAYYQVLGMCLPFLNGILSATLAGQELSAGAFQNMLSAARRAPAFFSKLLVFVSFSAGAVLLASTLFGAGFYFLQGERVVGGVFYAAAALMLAGGNLCSCFFHFMLAFSMNKGVTVGVGLVESLLAALLVTGMGDGLWPFVPAAWATRSVALLLQKFRFCAIMGREWDMALSVCAVATLGSLLAFYLWACFWDGTRGSE